MSEAKEVSKEAFPFFIGRLLSHLINFIIIMFLARLLGPNDYGIFSLGITLLMLFYTLSVLGVDCGAPYFISRELAKGNDKKARSVYDQAFKLRVLASLTASIIFYLLSDWIAAIYNIPSLNSILKIMAAGTFAYSMLYFFPTVYQGFKKLKYSMFQDLFFTGSRFIIFPLVVIAGLLGAVYGQVISTFITLIAVLILVYKKVLPKSGKEKSMYSKLIKYSLISYLGVIIAYLSGYIGNIIIGFYPEHVAYLNLSQRIVVLIGLPAGALGTALFPSISRKLKKEKINEVFSSIAKYTTLLSCFASFLVITVASEAITILLTRTYLPGLTTIQLMMAGGFFFSAIVPFEALFLGINKPSVITKGRLIQGLTSILLTLLLVINLKSIGVAVAYLSSNLICGLYLLIKSRKIKTDYPLSYLLKVLVCALIGSSSMLINLNSTILNALAKTGSFIGLFLVIGYLLGIVRQREYSLIKRTVLSIMRKKL